MATCEWCGESFDVPHTRGPKPKFCRPSHRQRAYERRRWRQSVPVFARLVMTEEPHDPFTQFQEGAAHLHECFVSYKAAGFAPNEALYLVGQMLAAAIHRPPSEP